MRVILEYLLSLFVIWQHLLPQGAVLFFSLEQHNFRRRKVLIRHILYVIIPLPHLLSLSIASPPPNSPTIGLLLHLFPKVNEAIVVLGSTIQAVTRIQGDGRVCSLHTMLPRCVTRALSFQTSWRTVWTARSCHSILLFDVRVYVSLD